MSRIFNIYCDESSHLVADGLPYMVLGGISCPDSEKNDIFDRIKDIKRIHGMSYLSEMKWTKVSNPKLAAYKDLINYFFDNNEINFRAVVVDKNSLDCESHGHSHDDFYYKMYWLMLEWFVTPTSKYNIYLDIKDTLGAKKTRTLRNVLCNSQHDFDREIITKIEEVKSHHVVTMQIVDILIGAVVYANRFPEGGDSEAKNKIVDLIKHRSGLSLKKSTLLGARKVNLLHWEGKR